MVRKRNKKGEKRQSKQKELDEETEKSNVEKVLSSDEEDSVILSPEEIGDDEGENGTEYNEEIGDDEDENGTEYNEETADNEDGKRNKFFEETEEHANKGNSVTTKSPWHDDDSMGIPHSYNLRSRQKNATKDRENVVNKRKLETSPEKQLLVKGTVMLLLMAVIYVILLPYMFAGSDDISSIKSNIKSLSENFSNQTSSTFRKIESRMLSFIDHQTAPQPFVLLIASKEEDRSVAECLANRVSKILTSVSASSVDINGMDYTGTLSDKAKLAIDNNLRKIFNKGKFPSAAIIHNLDYVPYGATTLFYAYCDHENPIFHEAAIIFTVTLPQSYAIREYDLAREALVEKYLKEDSPWVHDKDFSIDVVTALISRITDTMVIVNKESEELLRKLC